VYTTKSHPVWRKKWVASRLRSPSSSFYVSTLTALSFPLAVVLQVPTLQVLETVLVMMTLKQAYKCKKMKDAS